MDPDASPPSHHMASRAYNQTQRALAGSAHSLVRFLGRHKWKVAIAILAVLFYVNYTQTARAVFFVVFLTALAGVSTIYKLKVKLSFGFELVTMAVVLTTVMYGALVGAVVGLVGAITAEVVPQMIESSSVFWVTATMLSAFPVAAVNYLFHPPLLTLALVSFFVQIAIAEPIRIFGPAEIRLQGYLYIISGLIWNIFIFTSLAPFIYQFMA